MPFKEEDLSSKRSTEAMRLTIINSRDPDKQVESSTSPKELSTSFQWTQGGEKNMHSDPTSKDGVDLTLARSPPINMPKQGTVKKSSHSSSSESN